MSRRGNAPSVDTEVQEMTRRIVAVRGERVILDVDLARLYAVSTKRLNEQVRRNRKRFPPDFVFQLSRKEEQILRSQFATSSSTHGGRRSLANAFTEHGAIMAANVLNSERAIQMSVVVVRAFVALRRFTLSSTDLARRLDELEARYDQQFGVVFEAVRRLMTPIDAPKRRIGFKAVARERV